MMKNQKNNIIKGGNPYKTYTANIRSFFRFVIALLSILLSQTLLAASYYLSIDGDNKNKGSETHPWSTFSHAFYRMNGGDTLYVKDGTYNQALYNPPSGSEFKYTTIKSVNRYGSIIDGEALDRPALNIDNGFHHIKIDGFHFKSGHHTGSTNAAAIGEAKRGDNSTPNDGTSHIQLIGNVFQGRDRGEANQYASLVVIAVSKHILIEENATFGKANKYHFFAFKSSDLTFRRNIVRWDAVNPSKQGPGQPSGSMALYDTSNSIVENNIALDGQHTSSTSTTGFYMPAHYIGCDNNSWYGNIALNNQAQSAFALDPGGNYTNPGRSWTCNNQTLKNNIAWRSNNGSGHGFNIGQGGGEFMSGVSISNNTSGGNPNGRGITIHHNPKKHTFNDNLVIGNGKAFNCSNSTYNFNNGILFKNSELFSGSGCTKNISNILYTDPKIKYLTRVEDSSIGKGMGKNNSDIGATIIQRYQDGQLTNKNLWPWPYDDKLHAILCKKETRGVCGSDSITEYIWEYLGNPIPPSILNENDNPSPSKPSSHITD